MFGVPAIFLFMAQHPAFAETDLSSVRLLCVGGAPCPLPLLKAYLARGVSMQQGYGLAETAPMVSFLAPEYALTKVGSSGKTPMFVGRGDLTTFRRKIDGRNRVGCVGRRG
jgi:fatty-acyl-CoA synthase